MRYRITHITADDGDEPVSVGHNEARLCPRQLLYQTCHHHELQIDPAPSLRSPRTDYFGNVVATFSFNQGYSALRVTAISEVTVRPRVRFNEAETPSWESIAERLRTYETQEDLDAAEFVFDSPRVRQFPGLKEYALEVFTPGKPILTAIAELNTRIFQDFVYDPTATTVSTPVEEVFEHRRGVCQDFAHLGIALVRALGLSARYVSGYLRTYPAEGADRLVGADASHAWFSVYCGPLGWIDIDPTNNLLPDLDHVTVGWGRDYSDVPPLRGVFIGGGRHSLQVSVDVAPLVDRDDV